MSHAIERAAAGFAESFGEAAAYVAFAPGRVNLIGEHTDYNGGFVLPMAIELGTRIAIAPREGRRLDVYSAHFDQRVDIDLDAPAPDDGAPWSAYIAGAAMLLERDGYRLGGAAMYIDADVPIGCGLSSSASFEMAAVKVFEACNGFVIDDTAAAKLGQRIENEVLGLRTGIMDQFVSRVAKPGHAVFIDCRSLDYAHIPADLPGAVFIIADSGAARGLTDSKYNERVAECEAAVQAMGAGTIASLRDATRDVLDAARTRMSDTVYRRARHVVAENARTLEAREALAQGESLRFGALMDASDASLRDDYEVTGPLLDFLTATARTLPGCFGARMTGAGFGGCTVNLVAENEAARFSDALRAAYAARFGREPAVFVSRPGGGARAVAL